MIEKVWEETGLQKMGIKILLSPVRDYQKTAPQITEEINMTRLFSSQSDTCEKTFEKGLSVGLCICKISHFFIYRKRNRDMSGAKDHRNWTCDDWKQAFWASESKIKLFG